MQRFVLSLCAATVLVLGVADRVHAHHAFAAEFDAQKPVRLKGKVTKVEWINPHMWLYLEVRGTDGRPVVWAIEGAAPNSMFRRGIRKDSLISGIEVTVEGFQAKNGKNIANGRRVTWPDGVSLFVGSSGTGGPDDAKE